MVVVAKTCRTAGKLSKNCSRICLKSCHRFCRGRKNSTFLCRAAELSSVALAAELTEILSQVLPRQRKLHFSLPWQKSLPWPKLLSTVLLLHYMALQFWHAGHTITIKDNHMAPAGCRTHRHASRDILQNMIISYITYITSHLGYTTSHASCKNKLDASTYCCKFYVASRFAWQIDCYLRNHRTHWSWSLFNSFRVLTQETTSSLKPQPN